MVPEARAEVLMTKGAGVTGAGAMDTARDAVADCTGELASVTVTPKE